MGTKHTGSELENGYEAARRREAEIEDEIRAAHKELLRSYDPSVDDEDLAPLVRADCTRALHVGSLAPADRLAYEQTIRRIDKHRRAESLGAQSDWRAEVYD